MNAHKFDPGKLLFGLALVAMGFWAGTQASAALGLIGFLPFFCAGVMLVIAAFRPTALPPDEQEKE